MKAMKGLSMNKVLGGIKRRTTNGIARAGTNGDANGSGSAADHTDDAPEAVASRNLRLFCESGGRENAGEEVTFLPAIVDAAESSPAAAAECARIIRKYLHKDFWSKPSFQYNAIMLMRILADNPGATFTRSLDKKFVDTAKELLRYGRDPSVRQMLMETLDTFEATKAYDEGLAALIEMWRKEKEKAYKAYGVPPPQPARMPSGPQQQQQQQPFNPYSQNYFARSHRNRQLPEPVELANRLEEARTSAKLLQQVVACTPPAEVLSNDLIKEFADRCLSASRSIQGYMKAEDPAPDNDTMESLIDTNEQLQSALNQHQRAVLNARKHLGLGEPQSPAPSSPAAAAVAAEAQDGSLETQSRKAAGKQAEPSRSTTATPRPDEDPFADPVEEPSGRGRGGEASSSRAGVGSGSASGSRAASATPARSAGDEPPRLAIEPFHPGGFGSGPHEASASASAQQRPAGRSRGTTQGSEDLYNDSGDERHRHTEGGKQQQQQPVYRY